MRDAISTPSPSIAHIAMSDRETAVIVLTILITDLALFFNVGKSMGGAQLKQTIDLIIDDEACKNLKPEHYRVCFDRMKKGEYGKMYDRFDGQIIIIALHEYCCELADIIESHSIQTHNGSKSALEETWSPEAAKKLSELLQPLIKDVKAIQDAEDKNKEERRKARLLNAQPFWQDPIVLKFIAEFDEAYLKAPVGSENGKFIQYKNKIVNVSDYLQTRWAEHLNAAQKTPNDGSAEAI